MKAVVRFEADLLRILCFFLGRVPAEQVLPVLAERRPWPKCLSRCAIELVQEALAKGCIQILARGGWRKEQHLRGERVSEGRIWQRTSPFELRLAFSGNTLRFLLWVTAGRPAAEEWRSPDAPCTVADLFFLFIAYGALRGTPSAFARDRTPFATHGLCRLAYPADFQDVSEAPDFTPWTGGLGANILEALQLQLAGRWVREEQDLANVHDWEVARRLAKARERTLTPFLEAAAAAGRRDLARFLLRAAASLFAEDRSPPWGAKLKDAGPRVVDRLETYRAVLFFPRQLDHLQAWDRWARGVGYVDEGYAEAQLWKTDWERWQGDALHARAQTVIRRWEPL